MHWTHDRDYPPVWRRRGARPVLLSALARPHGDFCRAAAYHGGPFPLQAGSEGGKGMAAGDERIKKLVERLRLRRIDRRQFFRPAVALGISLPAAERAARRLRRRRGGGGAALSRGRRRPSPHRPSLRRRRRGDRPAAAGPYRSRDAPGTAHRRHHQPRPGVLPAVRRRDAVDAGRRGARQLQAGDVRPGERARRELEPRRTGSGGTSHSRRASSSTGITAR